MWTKITEARIYKKKQILRKEERKHAYFDKENVRFKKKETNWGPKKVRQKYLDSVFDQEKKSKFLDLTFFLLYSQSLNASAISRMRKNVK